MNRSSISLILCLCVAAFYFQAISGVGFGILDIPLKCYMRLDYGDGKQMIIRYHYFDKTSRCRGFMYSGQNGNENNFKSLKECMRVCHGKGSEGDVISPNRIMTTAASSKIHAPASDVLCRAWLYLLGMDERLVCEINLAKAKKTGFKISQHYLVDNMDPLASWLNGPSH